MTTKNMTPRTIALSEETAELFTAKRLLDECFEKANEVCNRIYGEVSSSENKLSEYYVKMNEVIMAVLSDQIDENSTESKYKVI